VDATSKTYKVPVGEEFETQAEERKKARELKKSQGKPKCEEKEGKVQGQQGQPVQGQPVQGQQGQQQGGTLLIPNSNMLSYTFITTIITIAVSGFILSYRRSNKNERNDSPPEPGVFRKSDTEKYST
jgi:hypothetical protein